MRIAIFHDVFENIGGGEKLVLTLARGLKADVISANVDKEVIAKMGFSDVNVISIGNMVKIPPLKQIQLSWLFSRADFRGKYDFFIFSGNWAHCAAFKHSPNLWYCHTPPRPFYDLYETFLEREGVIRRFIFRFWVLFHKRFDRMAVEKCDRIVVNSRNVQNRVKKYYNRESVVVHPPIDTSKYYYTKNGDFWLSVNRLYPEKRVDLQIEVFRGLPKERLIIIGGCAKGDHASGYARAIEDNLPANVELKGSVSEEELAELYANCKAFITTSMDEDFGMSPLEAMASGKPVVAVNEGGYKETIADGKTGFLVDAHKEEIKHAMQRLKDPAMYKQACFVKAKEFDVQIFSTKMEGIISSSVK